MRLETCYFLKVYCTSNNYSNVLVFDNVLARQDYIMDCKSSYNGDCWHFSEWEITGEERLQEEVQKMQKGISAGYDLQIADLQRRLLKAKSSANNKCKECIYKSQAETAEKSYSVISANFKELKEECKKQVEKCKQLQEDKQDILNTIDTLLYTRDDSILTKYNDSLQSVMQKTSSITQLNARLVLAYLIQLIDNSKANSKKT